MQITIKSARVASTGTSKQGEWSLIVIKTEDDKEYTTFHKGAANLAPGTVISIDELVIKDGKELIKEFVIVSEPAKSPQAKPIQEKSNETSMSPELWAEKNRLERWSRECNACFMGLPELIQSKPAEGTALETWIAALDYAKAHFQTSPPPQKPAPEATKSTIDAPLKDAGALFTRAGKYGLSPRDVYSAVGVSKTEDIIDLDEAWQATAKKFAATIKASEEGTK